MSKLNMQPGVSAGLAAQAPAHGRALPPVAPRQIANVQHGRRLGAPDAAGRRVCLVRASATAAEAPTATPVGAAADDGSRRKFVMEDTASFLASDLRTLFEKGVSPRPGLRSGCGWRRSCILRTRTCEPHVRPGRSHKRRTLWVPCRKSRHPATPPTWCLRTPSQNTTTATATL